MGAIAIRGHGPLLRGVLDENVIKSVVKKTDLNETLPRQLSPDIIQLANPTHKFCERYKFIIKL